MMRTTFILLFVFFSSIMLSGCASYTKYIEQQRKLSQLNPKYQKIYYELKYIGTANELDEFMHLQTDEEREDFLRKFWKRRDPTPTTEKNERKIEHERRVKYADAHFRMPGTDFWDDRAEIYIKYGAPDYIEEEPTGETGQSPFGFCGQTYVGRNQRYDIHEGSTKPWQKWYYEKYGLRFDFVEENNVYRLTANADITSGIQLTRAQALAYLSVDAVSKLYEQRRKPPIFEPKYEGKHLESILDIATFKGKKREDKVELYYGVPFKELGIEAKTNLEVTAVVFDKDEKEVTREYESRPIAISSRRPGQFLIDQLTLDVPSGNYTLAIRLKDRLANKLGIYKLAFKAPNYNVNKLVISDIQLASQITPTSIKSHFAKKGILVVPYPAKVITKSQPLNIYYEIYNLTLGSDNRTWFSIEYTIRPHSGKGESISITHTNNKTKYTDVPKYLSWNLSAAKPGKYDLIITVEDLNSVEKASASTTFKLIK